MAFNEEALGPQADKPMRVLLSTDCYCPSCGHNHCASAISSIDNEDGTFYCQKCSAEWREIP
jgi:transposase-like protein